MSKQLFFRLEGRDDDKCVITELKFDNESFEFPEKLQDSNLHVELLNLTSVKSAIKIIKGTDQSRNLKVNISDVIKKTYFDDADNLIFCDYLLQSIETKKDELDSSSKLLNIIADLQLKIQEQDTFKPKEASDKFVLNKYDGKSNVRLFLDEFESQCEQYGVIRDITKIEILKMFLKDSSLDWYDSTLARFGKNNWSSWKTSLVNVFGSHNWAKIRFAYEYKYIHGRFLEYALRKEKLILEVDDDISQKTLVNEIVLGLPINIQNKIKREKILNSEILVKELAKIDEETKPLFKPGVNQKISGMYDKKNEKKVLRKPCQHCLKRTKQERFHPEANCWFKDKVNLIIQNDDDIDSTDSELSILN